MCCPSVLTSWDSTHFIHVFKSCLTSRFVFASSSFWSMGTTDSAGFQWIQWTAPEPSTTPRWVCWSHAVDTPRRRWDLAFHYPVRSVPAVLRCGISLVDGCLDQSRFGRQISFSVVEFGMASFLYTSRWKEDFLQKLGPRISRYVECDYLNQIVLKQWKGWMSDDI